MTGRFLQRSLGAHWRGFTLGFVVLGAGAPAALYMRTVVLPEQPTVAAAPGDTVEVFGPRQFNGSGGSGTTYIERFTVALVPGRKYELTLVNGTAGGANRVTSAVTRLNGFQVIGTADLTTGIASVTKIVAVRQIDTLRVTVVGAAGSFVTASISSIATPEFVVNGPTVYGIPSGTQKTHTFSFTKPAAAGPPYRLYMTNGDTAGGLRVTNASVVLNSATVVTTTEFTNAVGSLTKPVTLNATNNVTVTLKGNASRFVTVWFTASDTAAPTVTITSPPVDSVVRTSPITVTGTITDASPTGVTVNGVQATVTNNTSYSAGVPLSTEGNNTLTVIATDAGGRSTQVTRNVIFDSQAPSLTVNAPTDNSVTKNASVTVSGTALDATSVTVNTNGTPLTVGAGGAFSGNIALGHGANVLTTTATDAAGNAISVVRNVTHDTVPPTLTVTAPAEGASTTSDSITVSGTVTDQTAVSVAANGVNLPVTSGNFSGKVGLVEGPNAITVIATDAATNSASLVRNVTRQSNETPPPDPSTLATAIDASIATTTASATAFLYTGPDAIQTGVAPGTIKAQRAGVIRGKVLNRSGAALPGVKVTILSHPEFGQTLSRADGMFDMAVNAGATLVIQYNKTGYLPVQREARTGWQEYTPIDSVAMTQLDPAVTTVPLPSGAVVARGSAETDADGTRRPTMIFESGTAASLRMPNGSTQTLSTINVRATEFTVGDLGGAAMPGSLPPTSAYTYAAELSVDEAIAAGAVEVQFTKPVAFYLENFLDIAVGTRVPLGHYDATLGRWRPDPDGRVIKILSVTGGAAVLDVSGSGQAASQAALDSLGITATELQQLAGIYTVDQTLWRTEHGHFTPSDWNWSFGLPDKGSGPGTGPGSGDGGPQGSGGGPNGGGPKGAGGPKGGGGGPNGGGSGTGGAGGGPGGGGGGPGGGGGGPGGPGGGAGGGDGGPKGPGEGCGSIISCENQSLGEAIPVAGTPFSLRYESNRMLGNTTERRIRIPAQTRRDTATITVANPIRRHEYPQHVQNVVYSLQVAGRTIELKPTNGNPPGPSIPATSIVWDGKDAYGRTVNGRQQATLNLGFTYDAVYGVPITDGFGGSFGAAPGTGIAADRAREQITLFQIWKGNLGAWDNRGQGLGGWSLNVQHSYDPIAGNLHLGTGERIEAKAVGNIITRFAGPSNAALGDGGPAVSASLNSPQRVIPGPDGSVYISSASRIRKVDANGIISTVAGTGQNGSSGDGGPATAAQISGPQGMALGADGSLYIAEYNGSRIRRVSPNGIISTVAGTGVAGFSGDGGPATAAQLSFPRDVAVSDDGTLYIADQGNWRIRRVAPNGNISTLAGTGIQGYNGDNIPARTAQLGSPNGLALALDGTLYITDRNRIRKVGNDGIIRHVAGGVAGFAGDGKPANDPSVQLRGFEGMAVGPDGSLFIADGINNRVRRIGPDNIINTVAGSGTMGCSTSVSCPPDGTGGLALQASLYGANGVAVGPDGSFYIAENGNGGGRVRRVRTGMPGLQLNEMLIASPNGFEFYQFDANGKHRATRNALTGDTLLALAYDAAGRLITVTDANDNVTTIERTPSGQPTAIVAAFGQRTTLALDGNGYISSIANPKGEVVRLYNTTLGLLDSMANPRGKVYRFEYDPLGRLVKDSDPAGGSKSLVRTEQDTSFMVALSTELGRTTRYQIVQLPTGAMRRVITAPTGRVTSHAIGLDGGIVTTTPDGNVRTSVEQGDPRWGMQAPSLKSLTVQTPGGLINSITAARRATLSDTANPLSILTQLDSLRVNGQVFTSAYDASTRRAIKTTPEGRQSISRTDTQGRIVSERTVGLDSVSYQYDSDGRLSEMRSGGRIWTYSYDVLGRLLSTLDPLGRRDSLFYNSADRLTRRVLPGGSEILFAYDSSGNVTAITPPSRPAHGFGYTGINLTDGYTPPNVGLTTPATTYQYNVDRQLTQISRPDSVAVVFDYDTAGRPSSVTFDRGQLNYGYSATTGNLTSITAPGNNTLTNTYDGSLLKTVTWGGAVQGSVGVGYNTDFRVTSMTVNGGNSLPFGYDRDGLLTAAGNLGIKHHAQHGLPERDSLGTVKGVWSYTARGALVGYAASAGASTLFETAYVRDSLDRITQITEALLDTTRVQAFTYDSAGRLKEVRREGVLMATYEYDGNGNRLQLTTPAGAVSGTYDAQDRLTTYGAASYTYGSNGELKTRTDASGIRSYSYDALGNLTSATLPGGTQITYIIDGRDRRVGKQVNGVLVQGFLYQDQLTPVAELDGTNQLVSRFIYGSKANVPDYLIKGGSTYRLISDHLGSVRLVVNTTDGIVAQRIDYDEFGRITQNTNPGFQPFGYAGGLYDEQTGLTRFGIRDYDAEIGRWTAKDPIGFAGNYSNLYEYVDNDPLNLRDPTGLQTLHTGVTVTVQVGPVAITGGFGTAIDVHGNIAPWSSWGGGLGGGTRVSCGLTVATSDASTIFDLAGPFSTGSIGAGAGANGSVDTFSGPSPNGWVTGGGFTVGAGLGAGGFGGATTTTIGPGTKLW